MVLVIEFGCVDVLTENLLVLLYVESFLLIYSLSCRSYERYSSSFFFPLPNEVSMAEKTFIIEKIS